eukprot:SAG31_NODE_1375_length_8594_cov_2.810477_1_plen_99_part_00
MPRVARVVLVHEQVQAPRHAVPKHKRVFKQVLKFSNILLVARKGLKVKLTKFSYSVTQPGLLLEIRKLSKVKRIRGFPIYSYERKRPYVSPWEFRPLT